MKAVRFIDYYIANINNAQNVAIYSQCISRPFTPKLLLSAFEGWAIGGFYNNTYIFKEKLVSISSDCYANDRFGNHYVCLFSYGKDHVVHRIYENSTLEDLVIDFTRVGIELEFKEEFAKAFFSRCWC